MMNITMILQQQNIQKRRRKMNQKLRIAKQQNDQQKTSADRTSMVAVTISGIWRNPMYRHRYDKTKERRQ